MKTIFTILMLALFTIGASAQFETLLFEEEADTTGWEIFANGEYNADNFVVVDNPYKDEVNGSDKCLKFTVIETADPWAGAWHELGDMSFTEDNHLMYMMVYKEVISNCALKVEDGAEQTEIKVPNTVTEQWETLEFDFSELIGLNRVRIVIFPDFPDTRETGSVTYIDNVGFEDLTGITSETSIKRVNGTFMSIYPNPAAEAITVQYPGMKSITISNIVGQTVRSVVSESNYIEKVSVSDLKSGVYFVTLDTEDGLVSSKFVKE